MGYGIAKAVAEVRRRVTKTGEVPSDAVRVLWKALKVKLGPKHIDLLSQEGLRGRVNDDMHEDRHPRFGNIGPVRVSVRTRGGQGAPLSVLVTVQYKVESGQVKPLVEFTVADTVFIETKARETAAGWLQVAAYMKLVREKLEQHGAAKVGNLPADVRLELEEKWPHKNVE